MLAPPAPSAALQFSLGVSASADHADIEHCVQEAATYGDLACRRKQRGTGLSYADLCCLPILLILVEKGRMGDTFPHTVSFIDNRVRCAQASCKATLTLCQVAILVTYQCRLSDVFHSADWKMQRRAESSTQTALSKKALLKGV